MLRSYDGARSTDAQPRYYFSGRELEVLHYVTSYKRAGTSQASFAVDCQRSVALLGQLDEFSHDCVAWRAAVSEEQITMLKAGVDEPLGVVDFLIQAHDAFHVVFTKIGEISFGRVQRIAIFDFAFRVRPTKG